MEGAWTAVAENQLSVFLTLVAVLLISGFTRIWCALRLVRIQGLDRLCLRNINIGVAGYFIQLLSHFRRLYLVFPANVTGPLFIILIGFFDEIFLKPCEAGGVEFAIA